MKISSRRFLSIAAVLMLLFDAGHTAASLTPASEPSQIAIESAMRAYRFSPAMGMSPTMMDAFMSLMFFMTVLFLAFGILNLILANARDFPDRLLRIVVRINVAWVAAFIAVSAYYGFPPPLIGGIIIELPLIGALLARN